LAATFVNPYTWRLHQHVFEFLSDQKLLDNIQEYQSMSFRNPPAVFFEVMMLLSAAAAFWFLQRGRITPALLSIAWVHLALVSARNIPLFMFIAAPLVGCWLQDVLVGLKPFRLVGVAATAICEICEEIKPLERAPRAYLLSGLSMLVIAGLFATGAKGFEAQFKAESFPIQAIPVVENSAAQHIFTYDQWGDYLIYRLYPQKRVFIDGRCDFYGMASVDDAQHIVSARYDWKAQLQRFGIDMVLVRPDAPLGAVLKLSPDWTMRFDDGKILVFEAASVHSANTARRETETNEMTNIALERRNQHD
jgi:hypothetical protein